MSDYSQVNETNYYFSNSVVVPQGYGYTNMKNSYTVPQSFQNSAYYKFKNVSSGLNTKYENGSDIPQNTKAQIKGFQSEEQIKDRGNRQQLKIAEGSQGLKFARIARAIDQLQTDIRCPYSQYFDGEKCVDNDNPCPTSQYYDPVANKCINKDMLSDTSNSSMISNNQNQVQQQTYPYTYTKPKVSGHIVTFTTYNKLDENTYLYDINTYLYIVNKDLSSPDVDGNRIMSGTLYYNQTDEVGKMTQMVSDLKININNEGNPTNFTAVFGGYNYPPVYTLSQGKTIDLNEIKDRLVVINNP